MIRLNFPDYDLHMLENEGRLTIFDPVRKKHVVLTPEEWVRQHVIQYLVAEKQVPISLIRVESEIKLYKTKKRFDIVVCNRNGKALLLVECKAPAVLVTRDVLDQAARYNLALKVDYLMLTNGLNHFFCRINQGEGNTRLIDDLPAFADLINE